jgi:hypothetical protein
LRERLDASYRPSEAAVAFILGIAEWFGDVPEFFFYSLAESIVLMLLFANRAGTTP